MFQMKYKILHDFNLCSTQYIIFVYNNLCTGFSFLFKTNIFLTSFVIPLLSIFTFEQKSENFAMFYS